MRLFVLLTLALLAACPEIALDRRGCESDLDCVNDFVCVAASCVARAGHDGGIVVEDKDAGGPPATDAGVFDAGALPVDAGPPGEDAGDPVDAGVVPECGNGALELGEECDDGQQIDGDGCSGCIVDEGFACRGALSQQSFCAYSANTCSNEVNVSLRFEPGGLDQRGVLSGRPELVGPPGGVVDVELLVRANLDDNELQTPRLTAPDERNLELRFFHSGTLVPVDALNVQLDLVDFEANESFGPLNISTAARRSSQLSFGNTAVFSGGDTSVDGRWTGPRAPSEPFDTDVDASVDFSGLRISRIEFGGTGDPVDGLVGLAFNPTGVRFCIETGCGDADVQGGEDCDDGNAIAGDGCSDTCTVEAGFSCICPLDLTMESPVFGGDIRASGGGEDSLCGNDEAMGRVVYAVDDGMVSFRSTCGAVRLEHNRFARVRAVQRQQIGVNAVNGDVDGDEPSFPIACRTDEFVVGVLFNNDDPFDHLALQCATLVLTDGALARGPIRVVDSAAGPIVNPGNVQCQGLAVATGFDRVEITDGKISGMRLNCATPTIDNCPGNQGSICGLD